MNDGHFFGQFVLGWMILWIVGHHWPIQFYNFLIRLMMAKHSVDQYNEHIDELGIADEENHFNLSNF